MKKDLLKAITGNVTKARLLTIASLLLMGLSNIVADKISEENIREIVKEELGRDDHEC